MKLNRRKSALERLELQLSSGVKTLKGTKSAKEPLSIKDMKRITQEITILKSKI